MPGIRGPNLARRFVWCESCRAIRWGEVLPEVSDLENLIAAAVSRDQSVISDLLRYSHHATVEELFELKLRELRQQLTWRRSRISPPRCLECGSIAITGVDQGKTNSGNDKAVLSSHPGCGGRLWFFEPRLS